MALNFQLLQMNEIPASLGHLQGKVNLVLFIVMYLVSAASVVS